MGTAESAGRSAQRFLMICLKMLFGRPNETAGPICAFAFGAIIVKIVPVMAPAEQTVWGPRRGNRLTWIRVGRLWTLSFLIGDLLQCGRMRSDATLCAACLRLVNGSGRRMYCALARRSGVHFCGSCFFVCGQFFLLCRLSIYFMPAAGCNIVGWRNERSPWQSEAAEMCPLTV